MASTKPAEMKLEDLTKEELLLLIARMPIGINPRRIAEIRYERLTNEALELMDKSIALSGAREWKEANDVWKKAEAKESQAEAFQKKYMS